jgi:hypothetical protein
MEPNYLSASFAMLTTDTADVHLAEAREIHQRKREHDAKEKSGDMAKAAAQQAAKHASSEDLEFDPRCQLGRPRRRHAIYHQPPGTAVSLPLATTPTKGFCPRTTRRKQRTLRPNLTDVQIGQPVRLYGHKRPQATTIHAGLASDGY